ncbi:MAG TPA: prepilin-type N-terminal cleavage/methylation domain-containing protein [Candidatus Eisenbacteria bacterium]|nr:prepilin-type N-terminal cleavage/methylation domain-containing protein [Candidatus Eisenbacteria bacterium]
MNAAAPRQQHGFSILELLVATAIFLVICGAMFELLELSQKKYSSETQLTGAFQEARLAIDQIVRDFDVSGYPAVSLFSSVPADSSKYAISPVAWDPTYPIFPQCQIGATCTTPGDYDLIIETDLGSGVNWIRYQLVGTTLYRSIVPKATGVDPDTATSSAAARVPFLTNVMNNAPTVQPAQFAEIAAAYPSMFPGAVSQPIFRYSCDTSAGPQFCDLAGSSGVPANIRDVDITLIVMTRQLDLQTQRPKLVELTARGHRVNPSH